MLVGLVNVVVVKKKGHLVAIYEYIIHSVFHTVTIPLSRKNLAKL